MISLNLSSYLSLCFLFFLSSMASNFHYSIDLNNNHNNEDHDTHHHHHHNQQPFFYPLGSSSSISSSSSSVSSLSYLPFLINSQEDQVHVPYNNTYHVDHDYLHLSQPLQGKMIIGNGGSSSSSSAYDQMVPKKETRLKLTIRKKDNQEDQTNLLTHQNPTKLVSDSDKWMMSPKMRLIKKTILNSNKHPNLDHIITKNDHNNTNFQQDHHNNEHLKKISTKPTTTATNGYNSINENGYGNNNGVIRVCSDCHTTKTPLWRSGPRGPKSLCNACGIRQRKARKAALAAAAAAGDDQEVAVARLQQFPAKKKLQNKKKRSNGGEKYKMKRLKLKDEEEEEEEVVGEDEVSKSSTTCSNSSNSLTSNKLCFDELTIMLSKSSAYQQVFPQDEKEAAILLMALSYGMVHG